MFIQVVYVFVLFAGGVQTVLGERPNARKLFSSVGRNHEDNHAGAEIQGQGQSSRLGNSLHSSLFLITPRKIWHKNCWTSPEFEPVTSCVKAMRFTSCATFCLHNILCEIYK